MEGHVFTVGVGSTIVTGNRDRTLAELERDLVRARALGAPDDATVVRTGPGSAYIGEVIWVGPSRG